MKNTIRKTLAAMLTAIMLCFVAVPVHATAHTQQTTAVQAEETVSAQCPLTADCLSDAILPNCIRSVTRLTDEQVEAISDNLAQHSNVYLVELSDGRRTYYMTVDLRDDDAVYFSNLFVMRGTSHKLYERSLIMAKRDKGSPEPILMSYAQIFGELSLHYVVYRFTEVLGGEQLTGLLGRLYRSSMVANLNVDEGRMAILIRLIGILLG